MGRRIHRTATGRPLRVIQGGASPFEDSLDVQELHVAAARGVAREFVDIIEDRVLDPDFDGFTLLFPTGQDGRTEIFNTVGDLATLALMRDDLGDFIAEARAED